MRKNRGYTQAEVSEQLGISRSTVTKWETGAGEPNALELKRLCEFFNVSSDYMCGRVDSFNKINLPREYNIDINKLNSLGKNMLIEYYEYLLQKETCVK